MKTKLLLLIFTFGSIIPILAQEKGIISDLINGGIESPLTLGGLTVVILYLVISKILTLQIFSNLKEGNTFKIINKVINFIFVLALVAIILGMGGHKVVEQLNCNQSMNIQYGVPQKVVDRLIKELDEKDIALQDRERVLGEWIEKYKELEKKIKKIQIENPEHEEAKKAKVALEEVKIKEAEDILNKPKCISGNCINGKGTMVIGNERNSFLGGFTNGKYVGDFKDGKPEGRGTLTDNEGKKYVGDFKDGVPNGTGTYTEKDGFKYVGNFSSGYSSGEGKIYYKNGEIYIGEVFMFCPMDSDHYEEGYKGTIIYGKGTKYYGEFNHCKENGFGTINYRDGGKYVGEFKDGNRHGRGTLYFKDGSKYEGVWKNDELDGYGAWIWKDGSQSMVQYKNGKEVEAKQ